MIRLTVLTVIAAGRHTPCTLLIALMALAVTSRSYASEDVPAWLAPLWEAAQSPLGERAEVQQALLEERRARLAVDQEGAPWRPRVFADGAASWSEDRPNNTNEVGGNVRTVRSDDTRGELGINQQWSSGTSVGLSALSARETNNRANAVFPESWLARVRLNVSQELLRGRDSDANRTAWYNAQDAVTASQEQIQIETVNAFRSLAEGWLEWGRGSAALEHARSQLMTAEQGLELARARHEVGLVGRSEILARERDVAEQQAQVGRLDRAWQLSGERLRLSWGAVDLPPPPPSDTELAPFHPESPQFQDTRVGSDALRAIERQQRLAHAAKANAQDSLTLRAGVGVVGRDADAEGSWRTVGRGDTFDLSVGLRYEHVIGGNRERSEGERARLALRVSELSRQARERDWLLELRNRERSYEDARAEVEERNTTLRAISEERDLIAAEFAEGSVGIRDLIDAEQRLRNGQQSLINAHYAALIAELNLRHHIDALPLPQ